MTSNSSYSIAKDKDEGGLNNTIIHHDSSTIRIVIVGAGVAGLTCARRLTQALKQRSYHITIVEARDRIGGRTSSIAELNLDLGASWIFSPHTSVRSLARELNLSTIHQYETGYALIESSSNGVRRTAMDRIHGGASRLKGGMGSLCAGMFTELMSRHAANVDIRLNSPVTSVTYQDDDTVLVTLCENNQTLRADYIVLALPPKLLISTIRFTPALPSFLIRQLEQCVTWMASTCKAVLVYDRAWWREQKLSGFAVSRRSKALEWHDASSDTCNALFVFCMAGTNEQEVLDATIRMFGNDARNPTAVHMIDWSNERFTSSSPNDGRGGHPYTGDACRQPQWNHRLWLGNSEVSEMDGGFIEGAVQRGTEVAEHLAVLISAK